MIIEVSEHRKTTSVATLVYDYFGEAHCPGHDGKQIKITTNTGDLHLVPEGKIVASLKKGAQLKLLGSTDNWYRGLNPSNEGEREFLITYIHKSSVESAVIE